MCKEHSRYWSINTIGLLSNYPDLPIGVRSRHLNLEYHQVLLASQKVEYTDFVSTTSCRIVPSEGTHSFINLGLLSLDPLVRRGLFAIGL